jgi:hypothetical protein
MASLIVTISWQIRPAQVRVSGISARVKPAAQPRITSGHCQVLASLKRAAASRALHALIEFQIGVIEQLAFPDQMFDVVLSTLMMHH